MRQVTDLLLNMVSKAAAQDQEFLLDLTLLQARHTRQMQCMQCMQCTLGALPLGRLTVALGLLPAARAWLCC